jgi:hypothetical protein
LQEIKGIAKYIVDNLVKRTLELSQGRNVGCFGFVDNEGYVSTTTELIDGGLSGIPLRILLDKITSMDNKSMIEGLESLPDNAVFISTRPGKTGLITNLSGVDFFNLPIISIGVKNEGLAGVGVVYPEDEYFDWLTESEKMDINTLASKTMEEEKEVLRKNNELVLQLLDVSRELQIVDLPENPPYYRQNPESTWNVPRVQVNSIDKEMAENLVKHSIEVGQGREVAALGRLKDGKIFPEGKTVEGGMGYVPSRLLASSLVDVSGKSLREIYRSDVPEDAVIVHTHPGGTGVMHIGDANAGPGTWGRPIVAIGHDKEGNIKGATVVENTEKLHQLAEEDESLNLEFFKVETQEEESQVRNRKFGIAQEYTSLCKPIEIN